MTGPDDNSSTRPISVSELLARHGTAGAPSTGGRRRRRRRGEEAVSVSELTGEIPLVNGESPAPTDYASTATAPEAQPAPPAPDVYTDSTYTDSTYTDSTYADSTYTDTTYAGPDYADSNGATDYAEAMPDIAFDTSAEQMRPDPLDDDADVALAEPTGGTPLRSGDPTLRSGDPTLRSGDPTRSRGAVDDPDLDGDLSPYFTGTEEPLFSGLDTDDPYPRQDQDYLSSDEFAESAGERSLLEPEGETARQPIRQREREHDKEAPGSGHRVLRGALVVGQSILAVAFGAGLFLAFSELWEWNSIVALILSVLVILGLVVAVRLVRKTEDTASTLIAVAVGALVTLGPLALMQSF